MSDCSTEAMKPKKQPEVHKQLNSAIKKEVNYA